MLWILGWKGVDIVQIPLPHRPDLRWSQVSPKYDTTTLFCGRQYSWHDSKKRSKGEKHKNAIRRCSVGAPLVTVLSQMTLCCCSFGLPFGQVAGTHNHPKSICLNINPKKDLPNCKMYLSRPPMGFEEWCPHHLDKLEVKSSKPAESFKPTSATTVVVVLTFIIILQRHRILISPAPRDEASSCYCQCTSYPYRHICPQKCHVLNCFKSFRGQSKWRKVIYTSAVNMKISVTYW